VLSLCALCDLSCEETCARHAHRHRQSKARLDSHTAHPALDFATLILSANAPGTRYFKSEACIRELKEACNIGKPMIPIYLEKVDVSGYFLGTTTAQKKAANFIRPFITGNCVPPPDQVCVHGAAAHPHCPGGVGGDGGWSFALLTPHLLPDQGFFQGVGAADFERNMQVLVKAIKKTVGVVAKVIKPPPQVMAVGEDAPLAPAPAPSASKGVKPPPQVMAVGEDAPLAPAPAPSASKGVKPPPQAAAVDVSEKDFTGQLTRDVCVYRVASGEITGTLSSTFQVDIDVVRMLADALKAPSCRLVML
jgi:hypothetical protein